MAAQVLPRMTGMPASGTGGIEELLGEAPKRTDPGGETRKGARAVFAALSSRVLAVLGLGAGWGRAGLGRDRARGGWVLPTL